MTPDAGSFAGRWTTANTLALLFGYILYTPIAHGPTGSHPQGLNARQILAHSVALAIVATLVVVAQRFALRPHGSVPWTRIPLAAAAFTAAFWAGAYQPWLTGPDWDILLGSFVLGNAGWPGVVPVGHHKLAATVAFLAFPVGCFLGQLMILSVVVTTGFIPNLQASNLQHSAYWVMVGVSMGVIGGSISGSALRRMLTQTARASDSDLSGSSRSSGSVRSAGSR
jgi:hypothetical protein